MHMTDKQLFASFFEKHLSGKRHCLKAHREPSVGARRRLVDFDIRSASFARNPDRVVCCDGSDRYIVKANGFMRFCVQAQGEAGWSHGFILKIVRAIFQIARIFIIFR